MTNTIYVDKINLMMSTFPKDMWKTGLSLSDNLLVNYCCKPFSTDKFSRSLLALKPSYTSLKWQRYIIIIIWTAYKSVLACFFWNFHVVFAEGGSVARPCTWANSWIILITVYMFSFWAHVNTCVLRLSSTFACSSEIDWFQFSIKLYQVQN